MSDRLSSASIRAQRVAAEDAFGKKLERAIHQAGVTVTATAEHSGYHREKLYPIFRGEAHAKAGALWRLHEPVRRVLAADLARSCELEVRPLSQHDARTAVRAISECCEAIQAVTLMDADGKRAPGEVRSVVNEIDEAMEQLAALKAQLLEERASVTRIGGVK